MPAWQAWPLAWLTKKLAPIIQDFDISSLDVSAGHIQLSHFRLSADALTFLTEHLCRFVPLAVEAVSIQQARCQAGVSMLLADSPNVTLGGVRVTLRTLPPAEWDVTGLSARQNKAKLRELELHSRICRVGSAGGAGFLHSLTTTVLDLLEVCCSDLHVVLNDRASLRTPQGAMRPFTLGGTWAKAELHRRSGKGSDAVLRNFFFTQPALYLDFQDFQPEGKEKLESGELVKEAISLGQTTTWDGEFQDDEGCTKKGRRPQHEWILAPSAELHLEIGFLQSRKSSTLMCGPHVRANRPLRDGVPYLRETDFAKLGQPLHTVGEPDPAAATGAGHVGPPQRRWHPLPRTGLLVGGGQLTVELTPARVEAIMAFVSVALLGYGSVIGGVNAGLGAPSDAVATAYGQSWLESIMEQEVETTEETLKNFESAYNSEVVMRAREAALHAEEARRKYSGAGGALCPASSKRRDSGSACSGGGDTLGEWAFLAELLNRRSPGWQRAYQQLANSKAPNLVAGCHLRDIRIHFTLPDHGGGGFDVSSDSTSDVLEGEGDDADQLRIEADELVLGVSRHRGKQLIQASLFRFRVQDTFGPATLQRIDRQRPLQFPSSPILVQPAAAAANSSGSPPPHSSAMEFYVAFGKKTKHLKEVENEPDRTLQLRSFGEFQVVLPPAQLLIVCLQVFEASFFRSLSNSLSGAGWRAAAPEQVLQLSQHGQAVAREIWEKASHGHSGQWKLDINLKPVNIFVPLLGKDTSRAITASTAPAITVTPASPSDQDGGQELQMPDDVQQAYVLCLGHVYAQSTLQPRLKGATEDVITPGEQQTSTAATGGSTGALSPRMPSLEQMATTLAASRTAYGDEEWVDEYGAIVSGLTFSWRGRQSQKRGIMPATEAKVSLRVSQPSHVEVPQAQLFYKIRSVVLEFDKSDVEGFIGIINEVVDVFSIITSKANEVGGDARKRRSDTKEAPEQDGAGGRPKRRGGKPPRGTHAAEGGKHGSKLWDLVVVAQAVKIEIAVPRGIGQGVVAKTTRGSGASLPDGDAKLKLYVREQRLQGFTALSGSTTIKYSISGVEVGDGTQRKLWTSLPTNRAAQHDKHILLGFEMEPAAEPAGQWLLHIAAMVNRPVILVWWPLLHNVVDYVRLCIARIHRRTLINREKEEPVVRSRTLSSPKAATPLERNGSRVSHLESLRSNSGKAGRGQLASVERLRLSVHWNDVDVLLPLEMFPDRASLTAPQSTLTGETRISVLRLRASWRLEGDASRDPQKREPEVALRAQLQGLSADFVTLSEDRLRDLTAWLRLRNRLHCLPFLLPSRLRFGCTLQEHDSENAARVWFRGEPVRAHLYPVTLGLLRELTNTCREFSSVCTRDREAELPEVEPVPSMSAHVSSRSGESSIPSLEIKAKPALLRRLKELAAKGISAFQENGSEDATEEPRLAFSCQVALDSVLVHLQDMPGKVEPLSAELAVEDASLNFHSAQVGECAFEDWDLKASATGRVEALDMLSMQVQPVLEPVLLKCKLSSVPNIQEDWPRGDITVSWVNLNLPIGIICAARAWQRSVASVGRRPVHALARLQSDAVVESDVEADMDTLCLPLEVVNCLGQPVSVRLQKSGTWHDVLPSDEEGDAAASQPRRNSWSGSTPTVKSVPPLLVRLVVKGILFEIELRNTLKVPQFETVRLRLPEADLEPITPIRTSHFSRVLTVPLKSKSTCEQQVFSVLFRAVPSEGGHSCALMICSPVIVHNNTNMKLSCSLPSPEAETESLQLADPSSWAEEEQSPGSVTVRTQELEGGSSLQLGSTRMGEEKVDSRQRLLLPLSWLVAAGDREKAGNLRVGLFGRADSRSPILPVTTLRRIVEFDFSQPHRQEESRLQLDGSLIYLMDTHGRPVHLSCTVYVGLFGDRACCLELVISNCITIVNHLPVNINVRAVSHCGDKSSEDAVATSAGNQYCSGDEWDLQPTALTKQYIAADEVSIRLSTAEDEELAASLPLTGSEAIRGSDFGEVMQVLATPNRLVRNPNMKFRSQGSRDFGKAAALGVASTMGWQNGIAEESIMLLAETSGVLAVEDVAPSLDAKDQLFEAVRFYHPQEWATYRRAVTIYVHCWVENRSMTNVWLRPAGIRGVPDLTSRELSVEQAERVMLPSLWASAGAFRICATARAPATRRGTASVRWEGDGIKQFKNLRLSLEAPAQAPESASIGIAVSPAELPFSKTKVIRIYDSVTLLNMTETAFHCWAPTSHFIRTGGGVSRRQDTPSEIVEGRVEVPASGGLEKLGRSTTSVLRFRAVGVWFGEAGLPSGNSAAAAASTILERKQTAGNALGTRWSGTGKRGNNWSMEVSLERATSFQVRYRTGENVMGDPVYSNMRVSIKKVNQGVATLVTFEPCDGRLTVRNNYPGPVVIRQKGVQDEQEILEAGTMLHFQWYNPGGTLQLLAEPAAPQGRSRASTMGGGTDSRGLGIPTMTHEGSDRSLNPMKGRRLMVHKEVSPSTGEEYLQVSMVEDETRSLMSRRTLSSRSQRGSMLNIPPAEDMVPTTSCTSVSTSATSSVRSLKPLKLMVEGIAVALSDATPLQLLYAAVDQLEVKLERSAELGGKGKFRQTRGALGSKSTHDLMEAYSDTRSGRVLLPPVDVTVTLLNLQVDSHIPGRCFPCVIRPFCGRSQLWRSLGPLSPVPPDEKAPRKLREPIFKASLVGCRKRGTTVVMTSCEVHSDPLVVTIDEALIVGTCAFYCRIAEYFNLPPFKEETEALAATEEADASARSLRPFPALGVSCVGEEERLEAESRKLDKKPTWLVWVEEKLEVQGMRSYISLRLVESTTSYLQNLQADQHVGMLLSVLSPFYSAALLQPDMLSTRSKMLCEQQLSMTLEGLAALLREHFLRPIVQRVLLLVFFSLDWLGNPLQLSLGVAAGVREIFRQPRKHGVMGLPLGLFYCFCSTTGSLLDFFSRLLQLCMKALEGTQRLAYSLLGVGRIRQNPILQALQQAPTSLRRSFKRGIALSFQQIRLDLARIYELFRWYVATVRSACGTKWRVLLVVWPLLVVVSALLALLLALALTLLWMLVKLIIIFLNNILQGIVGILYRQSAEAVGEMAPLQLFALELPLHVRPARNLHQETSARGRIDEADERVAAQPFSYLSSLAQSQLDGSAQDAWLLPLRWASTVAAPGEVVLSATWCGSRTASEGETWVLVGTNQSIALLHVSGWGGVTAQGRPARLKASYRWMWKMQREELCHVSVQQQHKNDSKRSDWVLELGFDKERLFSNGSTVKAVPFPDKRQAFFAFELFAPASGTASSPSGTMLFRKRTMSGLFGGSGRSRGRNMLRTPTRTASSLSLPEAWGRRAGSFDSQTSGGSSEVTATTMSAAG